MRKVWTTTRKNIPGTYVEWYQPQTVVVQGRRKTRRTRKSKYFRPGTKSLMRNFIARKFAELNSDLRQAGAVVDMPWPDLRETYEREKLAEGKKPKTMADIKNSLNKLEEACGLLGSGDITEHLVTDFRLHLQEQRIGKDSKPVSANTVKKHLRNLRTLINWAHEKGYVEAVKIKKVGSTEKAGHILSLKEIRNLLIACPTPHWRMRILLALCTGLRRSDIDELRVQDVNVELKTVTLIDEKTGKITNHQPLPDALMPELIRYIGDHVQEGQSRLIATKFAKQWYTIIERAGLDTITFHDLRRTFGSIQADAGTPIKALQEMYNHSSIETTMKHYIRTEDDVKRDGVNALGVEKWL